jgi:hypothetical protein
MGDSLNNSVRRIQRKLNGSDLESRIVFAIYFLYYIALAIGPIWILDDYYNKSRAWQEQSLIVIGALGTFSLLILLPPIVRKVITQSRSVDWMLRVALSLVGSLIYFGMQIHIAADPFENDVIYIPQWVGIIHYVFAALLSYYLIKNRRSFSRIELSVMPKESGVFTVLYGARKSSTEDEQQLIPRNEIPVKNVTGGQLKNYQNKASSTVRIHPADNIFGKYDCKIVAESQPGWRFDSWSVYNEEVFSILYSISNTISLQSQHSDLIVFAHFVALNDDASASVPPELEG